jgi:lysophospholipase L1-like esterase
MNQNYKSSILSLFDRYLSKYPKTLFLIFNITIIIGLLIFLESGARMLFDPQSELMPGLYQYDPHTLWKNRANHIFIKKTIFGDLTLKTNNYGFRGPWITKEKSSKKRVFCCGDSTTWGFDMPFENIYAQLLNKQLGEDIEVISSGVQGYSVAQCRQQIEHKLLEFKPDLITVASNYNDRRFRYFQELTENEQSFKRLNRWYQFYELMFKSRLLQISINQINAIKDKRNIQRPPIDQLKCRVPLPEYERNIQEICDLSKSKGFDLIFIGMYDNPDTFKLIKLCQNADQLDDKIQILRKAMKTPLNGLCGFAQKKLVELAQKEGIRDIDIDHLQHHYSFLKTVHGGFILDEDAPYREVMKKVAQANQVDYLDFHQYALQIDAIQEQDQKIFIPSDPCHLNQAGHELLAKALLPIIKSALE